MLLILKCLVIICNYLYVRYNFFKQSDYLEEFKVTAVDLNCVYHITCIVDGKSKGLGGALFLHILRKEGGKKAAVAIGSSLLARLIRVYFKGDEGGFCPSE